MIKSLILVTTLALLVSSPSAIRIHPPPSISDYNQSPEYANGGKCQSLQTASCHPSLLHIAATLDFKYLRGSIASVHSILRHAACPKNVRLHFITADFSAAAADLAAIVKSAFPRLSFEVYPFRKESEIKRLISSAIRPALEDPLNYARIYLSEILDRTRCVFRLRHDRRRRDREAVVDAADEIESDRSSGVLPRELDELLQRRVLVGSEALARAGREGGVLLQHGGDGGGSGEHGLGGDNVVDSCRRLHGGAVSLMHWSGKGKPWVRLDRGRPCPIDYVWASFDLYRSPKY
ncbi:hypothetical protein AAHA92_27346 [Salvia divinorum]|uniref:Hexosyltransferase n=1 Tax=Salvia divinorum TaxID=28513 RepID=A0ABD1G422_SALDI